NIDSKDRIYELFWNKYPGVIRILLDNQFIYYNYWQHLRGLRKDWKTDFERENQKAFRLLQDPNRSVELISIVMNRLYVMRNQLMHGGATYQSSVNRDQIRDCANFMSQLLPIIIELMIENSEEAWGEIYFPVVDARTSAE
ncbi:MAG: hypothetical protein RLZZ599_623, partial [Bacteroidota bacterium]